MSSCTFVVIDKGEIRYYVEHYTAIKDILKATDDIKRHQKVKSTSIFKQSDTFILPAVIINFDTKELVNTEYNWFDDFQDYLPIGWTYSEFRRQ